MLTAQIVERAALRYTPAGLPALDLSLKHESALEQLGQSRKTVFELRARAIGELTGTLLQAELGTVHGFEGFLGSQRNGRGIVFHIQAFDRLVGPST